MTSVPVAAHTRRCVTYRVDERRYNGGVDTSSCLGGSGELLAIKEDRVDLDLPTPMQPCISNMLRLTTQGNLQGVDLIGSKRRRVHTALRWRVQSDGYPSDVGLGNVIGELTDGNLALPRHINSVALECDLV